MKGLVLLAGSDNHYQSDRITELYKKRMNHIYYREKPTDELFKEIKAINPNYLFISYTHRYLREKSFGKLGIPVFVATGDIHRRLGGNELRKFVEFHNAIGIVTDLKCSFPAIVDYLQNPDIKMFWSKWGLDLDIMKDYDEEKVDDVMFSGKFSNYEYRKILHNMFSVMEHINYKYYGSELTNNISYEQYAHNINKSWICVGGCTQNRYMNYYKNIFIGYTFPKTLEIPAAASCLINSHFGDERHLGFEDGVNCILFNNAREAIRKVKYYLNNKEELKEITKKGYELVHKNHNINICVNSLIDEMEKNLK